MSWFQKLREEAIVARPALPTDRPALADLQVRAGRRHSMLAVEDQVALLNSGMSTMTFVRERATGFLGLHLREPAAGELWVDAAMITLAAGTVAGKALQILLRAATPALVQHGVKGLVCLTVETWLQEALLETGFVEVDQVITYARSGRTPSRAVGTVAHLRPAGPADADTVLALNAAAFSPLWRYDSATVLSWLFTADHATLAERAGRALGFALTSRTLGNGYDQLIRLATHPEAQGQGIGRQLVADAITFSQHGGGPGLTLNTQASNTVSRHLYETLDFRATGTSVRVMVWQLGK